MKFETKDAAVRATILNLIFLRAENCGTNVQIDIYEVIFHYCHIEN